MGPDPQLHWTLSPHLGRSSPQLVLDAVPIQNSQEMTWILRSQVPVQERDRFLVARYLSAGEASDDGTAEPPLRTHRAIRF